MKEEILSIASYLREGSLTTNEAVKQLKDLFEGSKAKKCGICGSEKGFYTCDKCVMNYEQNKK